MQRHRRAIQFVGCWHDENHQQEEFNRIFLWRADDGRWQAVGMKKFIGLTFLLLASLVPLRAAGAEGPAILKEPADWRFEAMAIPPGFAPDIKLTGSEEIRFAPGMFDTRASSYFTYVVVILADGAPELGGAELKEFLEKYYRGLSIAVGRGKGLSPDAGQMKAVVTPAPPGPDKTKRFVAEVVFFDSFTDGRKINLHVEALVVPRTATKQTCLIMLVSPSVKEATVWQTLREIGSKAARNAAGKN